MLIYKITNNINGKIYIGKTTGSLKCRWKEHRCTAKIKHNTPISRSIYKYGHTNFTIDVLSYHNTLDDLNRAEIDAIKKFKSEDKNIGYNLTPGGDGAPLGNSYMKGHHHSDVTRQKIATSHTGLKYGPQSLEHRKKISQALQGLVRAPLSEEQCKKRSEVVKKSWDMNPKRRVFSKEHLKNLSLSHIGKKHGPMNPDQKRKISESHMGMSYGPLKSEHKKKISLALRGVKKGIQSQEHRRKLSESMIRWHQNKKFETDL